MPTLCWIAPGDAERDVELRRDGLPGLARPAPSRGTSRRRRPRASPRRRRRAPTRAPRRSRSPRARRARARRRRSRPPPRSTGRSMSSCRCSTSRACGREVLERRRDLADLRRAARLDRVERPGADEAEARRRRPADLDEHRVAERRARADELAALAAGGRSRSQLRPASSRAASPAATSAASTEAAKSTFSAPDSATTASSASTRGCGSGAASASSSTT